MARVGYPRLYYVCPRGRACTRACTATAVLEPYTRRLRACVVEAPCARPVCGRAGKLVIAHDVASVADRSARRYDSPAQSPDLRSTGLAGWLGDPWIMDDGTHWRRDRVDGGSAGLTVVDTPGAGESAIGSDDAIVDVGDAAVIERASDRRDRPARVVDALLAGFGDDLRNAWILDEGRPAARRGQSRLHHPATATRASAETSQNQAGTCTATLCPEVTRPGVAPIPSHSCHAGHDRAPASAHLLDLWSIAGARLA